MNYRYVVAQLGFLFVVLSAVMLAMAAWFFLVYVLFVDYDIDPYARSALIYTGIAGLLIGGVTWLLTHSGAHQLGRKEALMLVALSWILGTALAAMPFYFWAQFNPEITSDHPFYHYTDCYFEAMSGLTTTGATILGGEGASIEAIPRSLLLWRSTTHWLGGLGIVVLFVAVLPSLGVGAKKLFRTEVTGPQPKGLTPHIRETARVIAYIYIGCTVLCILLLRATGAMDWFESICHTFSMVSTGGLSPRDASIGAYDSWAVDMICLFFMVFAGINFAVFYMCVRGQWKKAWKDTEMRFYFALIAMGIALVMLFLWGIPTITSTTGKVIENVPWESFRFSAFQVISLHTGTGYVTADYDLWPFLAKIVFFVLMFVGGCAGSTAGGIKVIRVWIVFKILVAHFEKTFRPQVVRPLKVGESIMDDDVKLAAIIYVTSFCLLFALGAIVLRAIEGEATNFTTTMSASISTLGNIGPGVEGVGPVQNYGWFSAPSKWIMSALMLLGRLEIFTVLILLTPRFWRTN
jgi:trk system potassium uptake protein